MHICEVCNKSFTRKDNLSRHLSGHGEKSFQCSHCSKCYSQQVKRKVHTFRHHTNDKQKLSNKLLSCGYCSKICVVSWDQLRIDLWYIMVSTWSNTSVNLSPFKCNHGISVLQSWGKYQLLVSQNQLCGKGIWTTRTQDNSYPGQLVPNIAGTQDNSYPGHLVPKTTGARVVWYDMLWYDMIQDHTMSSHIISYHITLRCHISCHILSYPTISYHIISYHIIYIRIDFNHR